MKTRLQVIVKRNDFAKIAKRLPVASREIVRETLEVIRDHMRRDMELAKSGRWYLRDYGWHQASAPGQSPAIDYGQLHSSLRVEMTERTSGVVRTDVYYAPFLEFGTRKMAPRPFMEPALLANVDNYIKRMMELGRRL